MDKEIGRKNYLRKAEQLDQDCSIDERAINIAQMVNMHSDLMNSNFEKHFKSNLEINQAIALLRSLRIRINRLVE